MATSSNIDTFMSLTCSDVSSARFYLEAHEHLDAAVDAYWRDQSEQPTEQSNTQSNNRSHDEYDEQTSNQSSHSRKRRRILDDDDDDHPAPLPAFEDQLVGDPHALYESINQSNSSALNRAMQSINQSKPPRKRVPMNQAVDLTRDFKREFQQSPIDPVNRSNNQSINQSNKQSNTQSSSQSNKQTSPSSLDSYFARADTERRLVLVIIHINTSDLLDQQVVKAVIDGARDLDVIVANIKIPATAAAIKQSIKQSINQSVDAARYVSEHHVSHLPHFALLDARRHRLRYWEPTARVSMDKRINAKAGSLVVPLLSDVGALTAPYTEARRSKGGHDEAEMYARAIAESLEEDDLQTDQADAAFAAFDDDVVEQTPDPSPVKALAKDNNIQSNNQSNNQSNAHSRDQLAQSNSSIIQSNNNLSSCIKSNNQSISQPAAFVLIPSEPLASASVTTLRFRLPTRTVQRRFERAESLLVVLHYVASLLPPNQRPEHIKLIASHPRRSITLADSASTIAELRLENSALIVEIDDEHT